MKERLGKLKQHVGYATGACWRPYVDETDRKGRMDDEKDGLYK